jgi:hypothetical protein
MISYMLIKTELKRLNNVCQQRIKFMLTFIIKIETPKQPINICTGLKILANKTATFLTQSR